MSVTPALTKEEWAERRTGDGLHYITTAGDLVVVDYALGERALVHDLHALAALALHGQPFGFTREDVAFLRHEAKTARELHGEHIAEAFDFDDLADRIEALLPPEDK